MFKRLILLSSFMVILTACSSGNQNLEDVTLVLDYVPNTNHSGFYIAKDAGYYEELGLNVDIIQPSQNAAEAVVASNQAEFGIGSAESVAQFDDQNNQLTSILALVAHNTSGFISRTDAEVTRPKDMEGKTYCGWGSDVEQAIVETIVRNDGGDPSKVNITTTSSADIKNANSPCDVMWIFEGWDKIDMDNAGIESNYIPFTDYDLDWYTPVLFTSKQLIDEDSELVQNFITASIHGYEDAISNPEHAAEVLLDYAPELDAELVNPSQEFLSANYKDEDFEFGYQQDVMWTDFIDWLKANDVVSSSLDVDSLYTNEFVEGAQ